MTYDLAVWEGERPDESNAAVTFSALYDQYIERDDPTLIPPTPAITAYVESLLDRWYEMGDPRDVDDTSPWSDAPLTNNAQGPIIYLAMRYSMAAEVSAACAHLAAESGLVCFDVQWNQLRPTATES
ncbi:hypothetical protein [Micromonospora sp. DT63]|uniref:hypothetical protein n=1 Tax=Micromonospora sp. DT63 TaxID=3393441 RepID=UPI003CF45E44